jgi:POT family proton-dependent oligopeptide transporter
MPKDPSSEMASSAAPGTYSGGPGGVTGDRSFFGHPRGLSTLFFTEFWERFSYYGMRALLILFMTAAITEGGLGFDDRKAGAIYGLYVAGVYLFALPGGWVADKLVGQRRAVMIGGILIACGHFSLVVQRIETFYLGLALIVLGTGMLKPNISTMVGELYPEGGSRRDAGFSIFYMGINLGAFVAPLITGWLRINTEWHYAFAAAGIGMVFGLIQYSLGQKNLGTAGLQPAVGPDGRGPYVRKLLIGVGILVGLVAVLALLRSTGAVNFTMTGIADATGVIIVSMALLYFVYMFFFGGLDPVEKKRVSAIFVLFIFSALFWSGFEQAGSSLNLFGERLTDRVFMGAERPAEWFQSVNSLFIIILAPVFAWIWVRLGSHDPSIPGKFALGLFFLGLGFAVMVLAATSSGPDGVKVSPMYLILTYLFFTIGELCVSPVGLSVVTKLAPQRMVGQMMGVWFMSISLGNLMAGRIGGQFSSLPLPQLFGAVTATTLGGALLIALLIRPIKRLVVGVR